MSPRPKRCQGVTRKGERIGCQILLGVGYEAEMGNTGLCRSCALALLRRAGVKVRGTDRPSDGLGQWPVAVTFGAAVGRRNTSD